MAGESPSDGSSSRKRSRRAHQGEADGDHLLLAAGE
jgi:hypothetical protein